MRLAALAACLLLLGALAAAGQTAAALKNQLHHLTLDPADSYRVRDLRFRRGDVTLYLNEGVLVFAKPIQGRRLAAVFTTLQSEAGDAEIVAIPGKASERVSLAGYLGSGALDEHVSSAVFFFSDNTAEELAEQIQRSPVRTAASLVGSFSAMFASLVSQPGSLIEDALIASLLDTHPPEDGLFVAAMHGRNLGLFHMVYDPMAIEPVSLGRLAGSVQGGPQYELWAAYRPGNHPSAPAAPNTIHDYRMDVTIDPTLRLQTTARFQYRASATDGHVVRLRLSPRLTVRSAAIDGNPAEVLQTLDAGTAASLTGMKDANLLLVTSQLLVAGRSYPVTVDYSGAIVERRPDNSFFVTDRATWYPHGELTAADFDLTFHYPDKYNLVATGNKVEPETRIGDVRTLHTRTASPEQLAGFNIGQYTQSSARNDLYAVDCFAERPWTCEANGILRQGANVLAYYSARWMRLPRHSLAVTPIPGFFGQGFPGLIYLANLSFIPNDRRPPGLQDERSNRFFSHELLPHEIAHQWWGNLVTADTYRSAWLMESMASYAALQFLEQTEGKDTAHRILAHCREDLLAEKDGRTIESYGPLDLGERLLANSGEVVWHSILYEKGTWVLHMLRMVLGDIGFQKFQTALLKRYAGQAIDNEQVREMAARFVPAGTPDRSLKKFFDTWVYGTGIPALQLRRSGTATMLRVEDVGSDFTADLPLRCKGPAGMTTRWISIVAGENTVSTAAEHEACELPLATDYLYRR